MDNNIDDFKRAWIDLKGTRSGFTFIKECWYAWNYWAQHHAQFSFKDWMVENNLEFADIQAKAHYPGANIRYSRDEGYKYYSAWRGAQHALDDAEKKFDQIFRNVWEARTQGGHLPAYTPKELADAIGKDTEQFRKFAAKRSWYYPRNTKIGTK